MYDLGDCKLGKSPYRISKTETREEVSLVVSEMARQSSRKLLIISRDLESHIYNRSNFIDSLKNLALNGRRAQIRILVSNIESIINTEHQILNLCAKLPSFIELRKISPEYKNYNKALLIADETGYLYRGNASRYEGTLYFNGPRASKNYSNLFQEIWEASLPDRNLRRLNM